VVHLGGPVCCLSRPCSCRSGGWCRGVPAVLAGEGLWLYFNLIKKYFICDEFIYSSTVNTGLAWKSLK